MTYNIDTYSKESHITSPEKNQQENISLKDIFSGMKAHVEETVDKLNKYFSGIFGESPEMLESESTTMGLLNSELENLSIKTADEVAKTSEETGLVTDISEKISTIAEEIEYTPVGAKQGSNEGGIYKNETTGELLYVKFYKDPIQGRIENLANEVYKRLGVNVPESRIIHIDGREAYASSIIEGHSRVSKGALKNSDSVKGGFVADAFLANWDVVGLEFDNIESGADGNLYRIDNGGTLIYRAQGGPKTYDSNSIAELDSLRNPHINLNSSFVFEGLTEDEIKSQAQNLVDKLSKDSIKQMVGEAELPKETAEYIIDGMIGRRNFLIKKYDLSVIENEETNSTEGISGRLRFVRALEQIEKEKRDEFFRCTGLSGDTHSIEGHQIDLVEKNNNIHVIFKMTEESLEELIQNSDITNANKGKFFFPSFSDPSIQFESADCYEIKLSPNTSIRIADNQSSVRALLGKVEIEISKNISSSQIAEEIEMALNFLAIPDGGRYPDEASIKKYKAERVRWMTVNSDMEPTEETIDNLIREEVFPGYFTFTNPNFFEELGLHEEDNRLIHRVYNSSNLKSILENGLLSSHTRYERGIMSTGLSTGEDFRTGGADNVFTRLVTKRNSHEIGFNSGSFGDSTCYLLISPSVLKRTDWYAYKNDKYGSTVPEYFDNRIPCKQFVTDMNDENGLRCPANEVMVRKGIPSNMIVGIAVQNEDSKRNIITTLGNDYVINGTRIEDFIVVKDHAREIF